MPSVYLYFPFCNHRRSGFRNIMNKYGLKVSPWIVPLCIGIFVFDQNVHLRIFCLSVSRYFQLILLHLRDIINLSLWQVGKRD